MATEKNNVFVELYDLPISDRTDDRFGRVVTSKSLREDDLINIAVLRRTDLNPTTLRASLDILKEIAVEEIANGASVQFGLGFFSLEVKGVFIGDQASWDPAQHSLKVKTSASVELRKVIRNVHVNVRGMASVGTAINSVTDVTSGDENSNLTPGGGVNVAGSKIKIAGDNPANGLRLVSQSSGLEAVIPHTSILVNEPKRLSFILPSNLADDDYKLSITTQYSGGTVLLKEPRTCLFDHILVIHHAPLGQ
jgi:hypothetical protein